MFYKQKKRILDIIDSMIKSLEIIYNLSNPQRNIEDCLYACEAIYEILSIEQNLPLKTIEQIESVHSSLLQFRGFECIENNTILETIQIKVKELAQIFDEEVEYKLNIVFFPYKASMWDSLESIYKAALDDISCEVKVVPIPYYQLTRDSKIMIYEGGEFPENIPIIHYEQYILEQEEPDIIFVHNIYDNYNTITQVPVQYFTNNLKKYTEMLVYVPYHISSFIKQKEDIQRYAFSIPSIKNVHKIILAAEFVKEEALKVGVPSEKLVVLGSPKFDAMLNEMDKEDFYPQEWKEIIEDKTVYMLNTGCMYFVNNPVMAPYIISQFLTIPLFIENSAVIWRPHPLTEASILKYMPALYEDFKKLKEGIKNKETIYKNVIFDDSPNYLQALKVTDVLISSYSSILQTYLLTEKRAIILDQDEHENSALSKNVFYYAFNRDKPWYQVIKEFSKGEDPLASNRIGMAKKVYANLDGSCGGKILEYIKEYIEYKGMVL